MKHFQLEGHKLIYHLERVQEYLDQGDCYPLYLEISPVGNCNHRCIFCAYDYLGYPNRRLETNRAMKLMDELAEKGLRSILFAGEGEPLIHPHIDDIILRAYENKIDTAIFTNGQLFNKALAEKLLPRLTFVRFSVNGGTRDNYSRIHSVRPEVFDVVVRNIRQAVELRNQAGWQADIGAQYVLLPENIDFLLSAVDTLKQCGIDYMVIKPFMQRAFQHYRLQKQFDMDTVSDLFEKAEKKADDRFRVIIRRNTFQDYGLKHYKQCFGTPFISVINSAGTISSCLPYWDHHEFQFGTIYEHTFEEIWRSTARAKIKQRLEQRLKVAECPPNCRLDAINEFLWDVKYPKVKHVNFI